MKNLKLLSVLLVSMLLLVACSNNAANSNTPNNSKQEVTNKPPKWEQNPIEDFDYEYSEELQGVIVSYKGESERVMFPAEINGDPVKAIGHTGNRQRGNIKEVYIPDGIQVIDTIAFEDYVSLKSVTLPDSVTAIGLAAFEDCRSLETVNFSKNLKMIDSRCF